MVSKARKPSVPVPRSTSPAGRGRPSMPEFEQEQTPINRERAEETEILFSAISVCFCSGILGLVLMHRAPFLEAVRFWMLGLFAIDFLVLRNSFTGFCNDCKGHSVILLAAE